MQGDAAAEVSAQVGKAKGEPGVLAGSDAAGNTRGPEGSSLISRMISSGKLAWAWSAGTAKALNFSNSYNKLSRKEDGVGAMWFADGHVCGEGSHPWVTPWRAALADSGEVLGTGKGAGLCDANLETRRNYKLKTNQENNNKGSKHRDRYAGKGWQCI